jgi:parallel beta-helix repeat protein
VNAYNISIKYNTLAENDDGITIEGSNYNNLIGNIIENNTNYGILIDRYYNDGWIPPFYTYSLSNNISLNTIRNNRKAGIYCQYSDGNIIIQNSIDNNSNGIYLSSFSILNQISNNDITNHNESGIFIIDQCDFNTVSDNRINYNYCGVNITQNSDGNELVGNNLLHNVICYTIAEDCDNTLLLDNVCSTETPNDFIWIILLVSGLSVAVIGTGIWYFKRKK